MSYKLGPVALCSIFARIFAHKSELLRKILANMHFLLYLCKLIAYMCDGARTNYVEKKN